MRLVRRLEEIIALLNEHQIPVVPFKGPLLAQLIYGDTGLRLFSDLDILVPRSEAVKGWKLLRQSGCEPQSRHFTAEHFAVYMKYENEVDFYCGSRIFIDFHWALTSHLRRSYGFDFCRDRLNPLVFQGKDALRLSDEDTVLHLCIHGANAVWAYLEMVLCVAEYVDQHPDLDWELVHRLAGQLHCERMLYLGVFLAKDVFNISVPENIWSKIECDKAVFQLANAAFANMLQKQQPKSSIMEELASIPYQLKLRQRLADKIRYILDRLLCPRKKDWMAFDLSPRMAMLYALLRPVRQIREILKTGIGVGSA